MIQQLYEQLMGLLKDNQFLQGGAILGVLGSLLVYARVLPGKVWKFIRNRFTMEVEITDRESAYRWVDKWLAQNDYLLRRARRLAIKDNNQATKWGIIFTISPGKHYLWFKRRLLIISKDREEAKAGHSAFHETMYITIIGRNRQLAFDFVESCRIIAHPPKEEKITIYKEYFGDWNEYTNRSIRRSSTLVLGRGFFEKLKSDLSNFIAGKEYYESRGIQYKRGYMFEGLPGNGKTSTIISLASEFGYDVALINMSKKTLDDDQLLALMRDLPSKCFLVIEDIDALFLGREKQADSSLSFSGLLNAIDGIASPSGLITFMTTNHVEKLDPALLRPGRVDVNINFGNATPEKFRDLFEVFYGGNLPKTAYDDCEHTLGKVSMAAVQGHFMQYRDEPKQALERISDLWN